MNIVNIVLFELRLMLRSRVNLALLLIMPVLMIALMGYAMRPLLKFDSEKPEISISQNDNQEDRSGFINPIRVDEQKAAKLGIFQFFGAGMLTFFLMTCGMGLGINIISERSDRLFYRIISFPVTHNQYLAGKALGNALIGLAQAVTVIVFTSLVFKLDWGNNYIGILMVVTGLMLFTSGVATTASCLVNSPKSLTMLLTVIYWMMAFISGTFAPLPFFEPVAGYIPNRWAFDALTGFMTGRSFAEFANSLLILLIAGLVFWILGVALYRRRVVNE